MDLLQVDWLSGIVLLRMSPAPHGRSLSSVLKLCVGLVGLHVLIGSLLAVCGHIPAPHGAPDLAMHNLSCFYIKQTAQRGAVGVKPKPICERPSRVGSGGSLKCLRWEECECKEPQSQAVSRKGMC